MSDSIQLNQTGRFDTGIFDKGTAEISAYDPNSQSLFVTNSNNGTIRSMF